MAAPSVRLIQAWSRAGLNSKRQEVRKVEIYGGTGGDDTDAITAASLSLNVIEEATVATYGNAGYMAAPNADGSNLWLFNPASPTAPSAVAIGGTPNGLYVIVSGY